MLTEFMIIGAVMILSYGLYRLWAQYMEQRTKGFEDRYMALYGKKDWDGSNMKLQLTYDPAHDEKVKELFLSRCQASLDCEETCTALYQEEPHFDGDELKFPLLDKVDLETLTDKRQGVRFEIKEPGKIDVIWNHMQADGVRVWRGIRPYFDDNPPILTFKEPKVPVPVLPELLALPKSFKSLGFRSSLKPNKQQPLSYGFDKWKTEPIRQIKDSMDASFNLVSTSMLIAEIFRRHPDTDELTVGLTVAFTFLASKNQYGVAMVKVKRGTFQSVYDQVYKQLKNPAKIWGSFSLQTLALSMCSDDFFLKLVDYFRTQIDVLISNLPVGQKIPSVGDVPVEISCYPQELSVNYYFLLLGTREEIHISYTSKFEEKESFLDQESLLQHIQHESVPVRQPLLAPITSRLKF